MVALCDRQVGMPYVSLLTATSGMATDEQINLLVVQLRFVTFFVVCERWKTFDNRFSFILL